MSDEFGALDAEGVLPYTSLKDAEIEGPEGLVLAKILDDLRKADMTDHVGGEAEGAGGDVVEEGADGVDGVVAEGVVREVDVGEVGFLICEGNDGGDPEAHGVEVEGVGVFFGIDFVELFLEDFGLG